jgi:glycosyltransferase involved in cell wall biosynthesis
MLNVNSIIIFAKYAKLVVKLKPFKVKTSMKHILIIVENIPVPFDKRAWQQALALKNAGFEVSVICPANQHYPERSEVIEGISIYRHPSYTAKGKLGYVTEYTTALFWEKILAFYIFIKKPFKAIMGTCPPDNIFLVALPFKLFGVKYFYDHRDVSPLIIKAKFGSTDNFLYKVICWFERMSFKVANHSFTVNQSCKEMAINRAGALPNKITIVRNGPDFNRFDFKAYNQEHKKGKKFLVTYLGLIGKQDDVDYLAIIANEIINTKQIKDIHFAIIGDGDYLPTIKKMVSDFKIESFFTFYGIIRNDKLISEIIGTSDVCVNTERPDEINNITSAVKVMEYMAFSKPIIQFDLVEARISADRASFYAKTTDDFINYLLKLLENPEIGKEMGEFGRKRVLEKLSWDKQKTEFVKVFEQYLN